MLNRYGPASNPVLTGQSAHHQYIEQVWWDVLHCVFMPHLSKSLKTFVMQSNNHTQSSELGYMPSQVWTKEFYESAQSDNTTVREVLDRDSVNFIHYGVDDDEPFEICKQKTLLKY